MLGGVTIPHGKGLDGHSDADVVFHALSDALLGALALGDLGHFFPDTDPKWKGADSAVILREVGKKIVEKGYALSNADITVIAEKPKLAPHLEQMRKNISSLLDSAFDRISIKARTHEKLGTLGREEGIAALAVVLVEKTSS